MKDRTTGKRLIYIYRYTWEQRHEEERLIIMSYLYDSFSVFFPVNIGRRHTFHFTEKSKGFSD